MVSATVALWLSCEGPWWLGRAPAPGNTWIPSTVLSRHQRLGDARAPRPRLSSAASWSYGGWRLRGVDPHRPSEAAATGCRGSKGHIQWHRRGAANAEDRFGRESTWPCERMSRSDREVFSRRGRRWECRPPTTSDREIAVAFTAERTEPTEWKPESAAFTHGQAFLSLGAVALRAPQLHSHSSPHCRPRSTRKPGDRPRAPALHGGPRRAG